MALSSLLSAFSIQSVEGFTSVLQPLNFGNNCLLSFNQDVHFSTPPSKGVISNDVLVGCWRMNGGTGTIAYDENNNNGTITGATWVDGKFNEALSFDGINDFINIPYLSSLNIVDEVTIDLWLNIGASMNGTQFIGIAGRNAGWTPLYALGGAYGYIYFGVTTTAGTAFIHVPQGPLQEWQHIVVTYDKDGGSNNMKIYRNGLLEKSRSHTGSILTSNDPLLVGKSSNSFFKGVIDEVYIYNRSLSDREVTELHTIGDPFSFNTYYTFVDSSSNNKMMVHLSSFNTSIDNVALVTCKNFFINDGLAFLSNNSVTANIWTNIGKPVSATGIWNNQNQTTTLALDSSTLTEIKWVTANNITTYATDYCSVSPSNVTVAYGTNQTLSFNSAKGYGFNVLIDGVSKGQVKNYTLFNITEPHSVNVTAIKLTYKITLIVDANSTANPENITLSYGENKQFNITAKPGYQISHVYVDGIDQGKIDSYSLTDVKSNHTISITSKPLNSSSMLTSTSPVPEWSQSPTSNSTSQNSVFTTETLEMLAVTITILIAFIGVALKKGYIQIEIVDGKEN
jgi:hypothetical protein